MRSRLGAFLGIVCVLVCPRAWAGSYTFSRVYLLEAGDATELNPSPALNNLGQVAFNIDRSTVLFGDAQGLQTLAAPNLRIRALGGNPISLNDAGEVLFLGEDSQTREQGLVVLGGGKDPWWPSRTDPSRPSSWTGGQGATINNQGVAAFSPGGELFLAERGELRRDTGLQDALRPMSNSAGALGYARFLSGPYEAVLNIGADQFVLPGALTGRVDLNEESLLAYPALLEGKERLMLSDGGQTRALPTPDFTYFSSGLGISSEGSASIAINDVGDAAFYAFLERDGVRQSGVYAGLDYSARVLGSGDQLDGRTVGLVMVGREGLNNHGQLAVYVHFQDGAQGIYLATPTAERPPGDANNDGVVDLADFGTLKANFGVAPALRWEGDFSADGRVDLQDFGILKDGFGARAGAVSEPATGVLVAIALFFLLGVQTVSSWARSRAPLRGSR